MERHEALLKFLEELDANLLFGAETESGHKLRLYGVNGRTFITFEFPKAETGFDIYIPASNSNLTEATFDAVRKHVKVTEELP